MSELDHEISATEPLFKLAAAGELDQIHTMAGAALLHSTYTSIESIFALIQKRMDGRLPESGQWHRTLLDAMTEPTNNRRAVISTNCRDALEDYLAFRHRFRHGYGWQLDPQKVALKLTQLKPILDLTSQEIRSFLATLK
ncbi:MAG: hypothetical protein RBT68_02420 [Spirochaetia bacterium]|jgi:uncharacterized protein YutE (UPF0331/DUF86 family)|nr:hypothetical protein [Spirochaetia bacterium]